MRTISLQRNGGGLEKLRFCGGGAARDGAVLESPGRMALVVNGKPDARRERAKT
jgi:hypothetical protein